MRGRWCLVILCIFFSRVPAAGEDIVFEHIGMRQGLSHNSVSAIVQDDSGIMWLGTRNGLNRYDGHNLKTYYSRPEESNSLAENQIKKLKIEGHTLWIQTFGGLTSFDIQAERFENHAVPGIRCFHPVSGGVWIGTDDGLYMLLDGGLKPFDGLPAGSEVNSIESYRSGLIVGTSAGIYSIEEGQPELITGDTANEIFVDSRGCIWFTPADGGVGMWGPDGQATLLTEPAIAHNFVRCITEDDQGRMWFGTLMGLTRYDTRTGESRHFQYSENDPTGLSHNSVWSLYRDRTGALWAGTYFGGVNVFHPTHTLFKYYPATGPPEGSVSFRIIGHLAEDNSRNLWIATEGGGISHMDRRESTFTHLVHQPGNSNSLACNNVRWIKCEGDSVLWISTHTGGINRYDIKKRRFTRFAGTPSHRQWIPSNNTGKIVDYNRNFLVATHDGVIYLDRATGEARRFLPEEYHAVVPRNVLSVTVSSSGQVWIGTELDGVARYDPATGSFKHYDYRPGNLPGLSSNMVNSIYEDRFGKIWIATSNALDLYDPERDDFEHISMSTGLPGNLVLNVAESRYDDIIITTNTGFSIYNRALGRFRNFTRDNGLLIGELNVNSLLVTSSGEVFIGGYNGLTSFFEKDLLNDRFDLPVQLTGLRVDNRPVSPGDGTDILTSSITYTDALTLGPSHSTFTIGFSDMGLMRSYRRNMSYMLRGFDKEWIEARNSRSVTYTNISPGEYTFVVRAVNNNGTFSERSLLITVKPPFYKTLPAFLLYGLVVFAVIFILNRLYLAKRKAELRLEMNRMQMQRQEEYNQSKLRFFTNISHEFRTPLTLVSGQLEYILEDRELPAPIYRRILKAFRNVRRLQAMVNELLDFRKQESGAAELKASRGDIVSFINEVYAGYIELSTHSGIDYRCSTPTHSIELWFDRMMMEKVFYNLLSNAFKFTGKGGSIVIRLEEGKDQVTVNIEDTGIGVPANELERIFDSYYQAENAYGADSSGTGLGLALAKKVVEAHSGNITVTSTEGKGTVFSVTLPKGDSHLRDDQKVEVDTRERPVQLNKENATAALPLSADTGETPARILVVEDNRQMLDFLEEILGARFEVMTAASGEEGFTMAADNQPDLVLSDVMMPGMSGTQMCADLKSDLRTSHIPVVLLTARTALEHKVEGLSTGADDYITKPFSIKLLIARIENILRNRKLMQQRFVSDPSAGSFRMAMNKLDADFIDKAGRHILDNIDDRNYSIAELASHMCMGRTRLFSKIKGITGQTPNDFIISVRLKHAVTLMQTVPDITIFEVATACGFSSQQYFSTCFKKQFSVSPSQFVKNFRRTV